MMPMEAATAPAPRDPRAGRTPQGSTIPASVPPQDNGMLMRSRLLTGVALGALTKALEMAGPISEEGKALHAALGDLIKVFGKPAPDLGQAEMKMLMESSAPAGTQAQGTGAAPMADVQSKVKERLSGMGMNAPAA